MPTTLDLEVAVAAYKVARDLTGLKKGESLLITIDSMGYWRLAEETAKAAEAATAASMALPPARSTAAPASDAL